jgi:hypothetical protein
MCILLVFEQGCGGGRGGGGGKGLTLHMLTWRAGELETHTLGQDLNHAH